MAEVKSNTTQIYRGMPQLRWRPWRELTAMALVMMEMSWLVAWLWVLQGNDFVARWNAIVPGLLGVVLVGYFLASVIHTLQFNLITRRLLLGCFILMAYLGLLQLFVFAPLGQPLGAMIANLHAAFRRPTRVIPVELWILALSVFLGVRGANLAMGWVGHRTVARAQRLGILAFIVLGLVRFFPVTVSMRVLLIAFLLSSLIANTFARADGLARLRGGKPAAFNRMWLLGIPVSAVALVTLSLLAGAMMTGAVADLAVTFLRLVLVILLILSTVIASPVLIGLLLLFPLVRQRIFNLTLIQEIAAVVRQTIQNIAQFFFNLGGFMGEFLIKLPDIRPLIPYLQWLLVLGVVLGASLWLGRRWTGSSSPAGLLGEDDERQDLRVGRSFLGSLLQAQAGRWVQRLARLRSNRRWMGAMRIRAMYAQLMQVCDDLGAGRKEIETPSEFHATLRCLFPDEVMETSLLTEAYVRVRYGELPETSEEVQLVEQAWRVIKARVKNLRDIQK